VKSSWHAGASFCPIESRSAGAVRPDTRSRGTLIL
jgi:hypothetical protein